MSKPVDDLTGRKFGKLTVIERAPDKIYYGTGKHRVMWRCVCDCGKERIAEGSSLKRGSTTNCGCVRKQPRRMGTSKSKEKIPKPITIQNEIFVGQIYKIKGKEYECINIFTHQARFKNSNGLTECFDWFDLDKNIER